MGFTKAEKRQLRELASTIYEAEVRQALEELDGDLQRWRENEIESSEMLDVIHDFHQTTSREIWSMYQSLPDDLIVERGISQGFIDESLVPKELLSKLGPMHGALEQDE